LNYFVIECLQSKESNLEFGFVYVTNQQAKSTNGKRKNISMKSFITVLVMGAVLALLGRLTRKRETFSGKSKHNIYKSFHFQRKIFVL